MNGKSKSILLQVAFKGAIETGDVSKAQVLDYYNLLTILHEELGIDADDAPARKAWGNSAPKAKAEGIGFIFNGVLFEDFRAEKEAGRQKATFPDFRTANGTEVPGLTNDRGSVWMYDQQGQAKGEVLDLVTEADKAAVLA